jgi:glycerol-3-phosphate acyltransferase PlsY
MLAGVTIVAGEGVEILYQRPDSWSWLSWYACFLGLGYALGSIPFGLILTRAAGLGDVRNIGSGNIGATNVLRTGHKGLAALTLVLDALKGTVAVLIDQKIGATYAGLSIDAALLAGLGAFLGHLYPVWLGFKGGKGVATYVGVLIGWWWPTALIFCVIWLATAVLTRYSSLSALVASAVAPLVFFLGSDVASNAIPAFGLAAAIMSAFLIWKHRANISRLISGEEPKIGAKA